MSAPETNIETQKKRHSGPLVGIAVVVGAALLLFVGWLFLVADDGQTPREATPTEDAPLAPGTN